MHYMSNSLCFVKKDINQYDTKLKYDSIRSADLPQIENKYNS